MPLDSDEISSSLFGNRLERVEEESWDLTDKGGTKEGKSQNTQNERGRQPKQKERKEDIHSATLVC